MTHFRIKTIEDPSQTQIDLIRRPLKQYNESQIGAYHRKHFATFAYDQNGQVIGGMSGWLHFGWLFIDDAWVSVSYRRQGVGSRILSTSEQWALKHGIFHARLNTGSFQAPNFYLKNGYEIFAQLDILAPDGSPQIEYFMKRNIQLPNLNG